MIEDFKFCVMWVLERFQEDGNMSNDEKKKQHIGGSIGCYELFVQVLQWIWFGGPSFASVY